MFGLYRIPFYSGFGSDRFHRNFFFFFPEHSTDVKAKKLYKPTSKLAELAATFQSVKEATKQEDNVSYRGRQLYCELLFCLGLICKGLNKVVP